MPAYVLFLAIVLGVFILMGAASVSKANHSSEVSGLLGVIGLIAIIIPVVVLLITWSEYTGQKDIVDEKFYIMQTVKKTDGGDMQIIVLEDGSTINMNVHFGRSFKGGEIVRRYVMRARPTKNITWLEDDPKYELLKKPEREDFK